MAWAMGEFFMWSIIGSLIGALIAMAGVVMVYDARDITARVFGFGDQNEATMGMKMIGFFLGVVGACIIYFLK